MSRHEDYDDYDDAPAQKVWGAASILVGVAALSGFMALAWYAYHSGSATQDPAQAELVQADPTPYKEVPKEPGGWQAPHRDKTIYEVIDNNAKPASGTAERLTAAPEEPMDVNGGDSGTSDSGSSTWMNAKLRGNGPQVPLTDAERQKAQSEEKMESTEISKPEAVKMEAAKPETPSASPPQTVPLAVAAPVVPAAHAQSSTPKPDAAAIAANAVKPEVVTAQKTAHETPKVVEAPKKAEAPKAKTQTKIVAKGGSARVQLGAFRSEGEAAQHVKHLGSRVPGILSGKSTTVERADLGEKGIYYRLFALNFGHEEALAVCARIKAARLDCMVK